MEKINFENLPSTSTPVNATNLNQVQTNVENAINSISTKNSDTVTLNGVSVRLVKIGKLVTLDIFQTVQVSITNTTNFVLGTIDSAWRPAAQIGAPINIKDNNWNDMFGTLIVRTDGSVEISQRSNVATISTQQIVGHISYFTN